MAAFDATLKLMVMHSMQQGPTQHGRQHTLPHPRRTHHCFIVPTGVATVKPAAPGTSSAGSAAGARVGAPPGAAALLKRSDAGRVSVRFWLKFRVEYGQSLRIIGGSKALGGYAWRFCTHACLHAVSCMHAFSSIRCHAWQRTRRCERGPMQCPVLSPACGLHAMQNLLRHGSSSCRSMSSRFGAATMLANIHCSCLSCGPQYPRTCF